MSSENGLLSVGGIPVSMITSPSVTTFLPEEDASTCLLLPATPSPPPMDFIHPLTPSTGNDENNEMGGDDARAETSSSGSSGIGMDVPIAGTTTLYNNKNVYQNLENNGETFQQNGTKQYANLNIQITKDTPGFVHWNWPLIRKCTFFFFLAGIFAMAGIVVAMIVSLPKACNPKSAWYRGSVFYEIFPASFQDYNNDGLGDLIGLTSRLDYVKGLGVTAVRLNSIFPSKNYPDHFQNVTTLLEIDEVLGGTKDLRIVAESLHARNMSLVLDLPLYPLVKELHQMGWDQMDETNNSAADFPKGLKVSAQREDDIVSKAIELWVSHGVDGFYIKGLENYFDDPYLLENIAQWKKILGRDRVFIISQKLLDRVDEKIAKEILNSVDLVDVYLDITQGAQSIAEQIKKTVEGLLTPGPGPYIQWSLGGVSERRISTGLTPNATLAATLMELMLPGSPSIFYGDEIALQESHDPLGDHADTKHLHHLSAMAWNTGQFTSRESLPWIPRGAAASFGHVDYVSEMVALREASPSLYKNSIKKLDKIDRNTSVKNSRNDILIVERWYPRRRSFVSISNFGEKKVSLDLSSLFYGGVVMVGKYKNERILFSQFEIGPIETIIIRLDK